MGEGDRPKAGGGGALRGDHRLVGVEPGLVAQAQAVHENIGSGIAVRIGAAFDHPARQRAGPNRA